MTFTSEMLHLVAKAYNDAFKAGAGSKAFSLADGAALDICYKQFGTDHKEPSQVMRMVVRSNATTLRRKAIGQ